MTDKEIKKALEYCTGIRAKESCSQCPACVGCNDCVDILRECALDLINRQEEMIDGLIAGQETLQQNLPKVIKAEVVKEFAKAYKDQIKNYTGMFTDEGFYVSLDAVLSAVDFVLNKTLEEMVEENNG